MPKRTLLVTSLVYLSIFLNFFLVGTIIPLLPRLADARGISSIEASLILSIKSFTHMTVSPILALMASRWKPVELFSFGQLSLAGAYMGCAFSTSFGGFLAARIAQGIGIASIMVAGMSLLVDTVPKEKRGRYIAFAYSALAHASLVAPVLSAVMYDGLGQIWTFLIPGIVTLSVAAVSISLLNRVLQKPALDPQPSSDHSPKHLDRSLIIPILKSIYSLSIGYLTYLGIFSCGFAFGCIETSIPQFMVDIHFSVLTSNLLWSAGALTFAISAPIIGWFIDKFHPSSFLISSMFSYVIFGPLIHFIPPSVGGVAGTIVASFFIQALAELSIYPLATCLVESASERIRILPQSVNIIGFCLVEMFVQAGFAVGNIIGKILYDWHALYGVGIGIASIPAGTIILTCLIHLILGHRKYFPFLFLFKFFFFQEIQIFFHGHITPSCDHSLCGIVFRFLHGCEFRQPWSSSRR